MVGFIDVAFKAEPDEPTGLALRGLAITLQEDAKNNDQPPSVGGLANLADFTVGRQRRVVRSTFGAELHGLVDSVEQLLLLQITSHHIYTYIYIYIYILRYTPVAGGYDRSCRTRGLYPSLDVAVDAKVVFDIVAATVACDPQGCSFKLHLISLRDRLTQGIIRRMHWVDTRDMLADGLAKGGLDRALLQCWQ